MRDGMGVARGACTACGCGDYVTPLSGHDCVTCSHKPVKHALVGSTNMVNIPAPNNAPICKLPNCLSTCYFENGKYLDYCGLGHAKEHKKITGGLPAAITNIAGLSLGTLSPDKLCKLPGCTRPRFEENGVVFDFCGKAHALYTGPPLSPSSSTSTSTLSSPSKGPTCKKPGCSLPVFVDGATTFAYCGKTHSKEHREQLSKGGKCSECMVNQAIDTALKKLLCITCFFTAEKITNFHTEADIALAFLPHSHSKFSDIKQQFKSKWLHSNVSTPNVEDVLMLFPSHATRSEYMSYRNKLEARGKFEAHGRSTGNECRRFHGTSRACTLGLDGNAELCNMGNCAVCNIIRTRFKLSRAKQNFGWGRFGDGLYFTSTSSKSHAYNAKSERHHRGKTTRVMFVVKVAVGKGYETKEDMQSLTDPPAGYDSVLGEIGQDLNFDECVVYKEEAALVGYLIVYSY